MQGFHFPNADTNAKSSSSYVESSEAFPFKAVMKKAIGCPSCIKPAPYPTPEASHLIMNS